MPPLQQATALHESGASSQPAPDTPPSMLIRNPTTTRVRYHPAQVLGPAPPHLSAVA